MPARTDQSGFPRELAAARRRALDLHVAGELDAAVAAYRAVLERYPRACDCWCNLGAVLRALGRRDEGLEALRKGLRVCPDHVALNRNLSNALEEAGDSEAAREHHGQAVTRYQVALQRRPDDPELYGALGWSLWKLRRLEAAEAVYRRAIAIAPASTDHLLDLGRVLAALGRYAENEQELRAAVARNPGSTGLRAALGQALMDLGRLEEGRACCRAVLAVDPDHRVARLARGRANFLAGRYAAAWLDRYRQVEGFDRRPRGTSGREWAGQDLAGQSILLYGEQGLGDVIQYARYAPLMTRRGARVVLACKPPLVGLLRRLPDVAEVVAVDRPVPATDWHCSLLDVPAVLAEDVDAIPRKCPYLPPVRRERRVLPPARQLRVGIVWAGNPMQKQDSQRSCRLEEFAPLFELPGAEFVSFQVGPRARALRSGWRGLVRDPGDALTDMEATADALLEVDLVITVDTMLAHLAGALGRPVWTLLAFAPDMRWMLERADTPWYPTMRLFRQPAPNDWAGVFREVRGELAALVAQSRRAVTNPAAAPMPIETPPGPTS